MYIIYANGELSITQRQAVIVCLLKPNKPLQYLKNWKPISQLITTYKLGSGCIVNRIRFALPKLINGDQTGFIPERNMSENTRMIKDIMHYTQVRKIPGMIMLIDYEKAFDTLFWKYLYI